VDERDDRDRSSPRPSSARHQVLERVADRIDALDLPPDRVRRVAVDGVDGVGKTTFADDLADVLVERRVAVVRASVDGFHHPPAHRYRRGRASPDGFYLDSYRYDDLCALLLDPLGPGGSCRIRRAVHDVGREAAVDAPEEPVPAGAVLVLDGIFLHRPELRDRWELSVFLDAPVEVTVARCAGRDGTDPDPAAASNRRYVEGQRRYLDEVDPRERADVVVDLTDVQHPTITRW
jgi:uridine kinase